MVLLTCEDFLSELSKMVSEESCSKSKSLWITYKRYYPNTKTFKRNKTIGNVNVNPVCLVRAKIGGRRISTHVGSDLVDVFSSALSNISVLMELEPTSDNS